MPMLCTMCRGTKKIKIKVRNGGYSEVACPACRGSGRA